MQIPTAPRSAPKYLLLYLGGLLAVRIMLAIAIPITGDEAYHVEWARHPDWCYYDHPAMVAWLMRPVLILFGEGLLSVRFQAVLAGLLFAVLAYRLAEDMFPEARISGRTLILTSLAPVTAVVSLLVSTDTPLTVFWALALVFFYRAAENGRHRDWVLTGLCLGLAFNSKFLAFGFLPAAALYLIIPPENRRHWRTLGPWLALGITALGFLPAFIWNARHDWLTFRFNFVARQRRPEFGLWDYLGGQLLFFSPVVIMYFAAHVLRHVKQILQDRRQLFLVLFAAGPLGGFLIISLFRRIGAHWTAMALVPLMVYFTYHACREGRTRLFRSALITAGGCVLGLMIFIFSLLWAGPDGFLRAGRSLRELPGLQKRVSEEDLQMYAGQIFREKEIAQLAEGLARAANGFCATPSYSLSSMLTWYAPDKTHFTVWASRSFYGRNYEIWDPPAAFRGQTMVWAAFRRHTRPKLISRMRPHFTHLTVCTFNQTDAELLELKQAIGGKGVTVMNAKDRPAGWGAFIIIKGTEFSGKAMQYE